MKRLFKSILLVAFTTLVMSGCSESDKNYTAGTPAIQTSELTTTKSVADINTLAVGVGSTPTLYTNEDIIEAYVTSSDAAGNFYKSISFQSIPTDSSAPIGFSVSVDKSMLFVDGFSPGRKVYIKLKGLYYATIYGSMQIGVADATQTTGMAGISKSDLGLYLFPSSTIVSEETMVRHMSLATAVATDANLNTLIEIDNTQFADNSLARTYFDINSGGFATNHDIVDAVLGGTTRFCRISQYASFSYKNVPAGRGSIRGVMTKYNSDYQFIVRQESDFKLTSNRTYNFNASLSENFASFAVGQVAFPNYINFAKKGTKKWLIKAGALEMSAFGGALEQNKSYFIVPVDMSAANTFSFSISQAFYNGLTLKIYRSTDFLPGMNINNATLYDITTSFNLPTANSGFVSAGVYNIPTTVTGNGYFIFEYTGTNISTGPVLSTTVDIDNIVVN